MLLIFISCKEVTSPEDPLASAVIVPGYGACGVRLGMYEEDVISRIGNPASVGSSDGYNAAWTVSAYSGGETKGMHVWYIDREDTNTKGPVDYIELDSTFTGKTKEGFGIGTELDKIRAAWNDPRIIFSYGKYNYWYYKFNNIDFIVLCIGGIAKEITIGPFFEK